MLEFCGALLFIAKQLVIFKLNTLNKDLIHKYKNQKVLNFEQIDLNRNIYRVFSTKYFFELFETNQNTLVKPKEWDDPFENFLFKQIIEWEDGTKASLSKICDSYYGQCWTLNEKESDALWRIYSPNNDGVRVKSTIREVWDSFFNVSHNNPLSSFSIGKVIYESENAIRNFYEDSNNLQKLFADSSGIESVQTLLCKRMEFKHENEVRLIYQGFESSDDLKKPFYKYDFEPRKIISEVLFDPRISDSDFDSFSVKLKNLGFKNDILKSNLYQIPNLSLKMK